MNITPTTWMIESMRKQNLQWRTILTELIDNAFDAGANRVAISFSNDQLEVWDDGAGRGGIAGGSTKHGRNVVPSGRN